MAVISPVIFLRSSPIGPRNVMRSMSFFIVMIFQILSSREFTSFAKVATVPWYAKTPMVLSSKRSLKQLLSSNVNKESLAMYFACHIIECKNDLQKTCLVTLKSECRSNNLFLHHLNTTQEEADTCMLQHAINAKERTVASHCIQSPDTDALVLALWKHTSLYEKTYVVAGTGAKR